MLPPSIEAVKNRLRIFSGVIGIVFVLKLVVLIQLKDHPLLQPDAGLDTTAYVDLARRVVQGDLGLGPGLYYVSPLYIYFLALGLAVFDSFTAVRVIQIVLGTVAVGFIFAAARGWFGERAGWLAAGLAALTGLFTFYEVLILQASIDAFLTSAALLALTKALARPRSRKGSGDDRRGLQWMLVAGVVFGIHSLNRPNMPLAVAAIVLVLLGIRRWRPAVALVAGLLAGMAPAAVRNVVVADQWSLVSSHGGLNFYIGNGEGATGFYRQVAGITPTITGQERDARRVAESAVGRELTEAETSDYFYGLAWRWIREHPGRALTLFLRKLAYVFSAHHIALPHSYPFYAYDAPTALRFSPIGPWLIVPLGVSGLLCAASRVRRPEYLAWVAFVPGYAMSVAAFFIAERYRLPLLVPLCVGGGAAIDIIVRAFTAKRAVALAVPALTIVVIFVAANWRLELDDGRWQEGLRMAQRLVILGKYDEADAWTRDFESRGPRPGATYYGVGTQLLLADQTDRALVHLTRAQQLDPGRPMVEYALGQALLRSGRAPEAVEHLRYGMDEGLENDAEVWLRWGRLAARSRAPAAAEPLFRHAVRLRPDQASARQQLGLNLLILDRCHEAVRELSEAARLDPRDPDTLSHLAYCELKLGQPEDARSHAEAALAVSPENDLAKQLLAALRKR